MSDPLTKTTFERMREEDRQAMEARLHTLAQRSRKLEDYAFMIGIAQAALYGLAEFLIKIGVVPGNGGGFPWMTIALFLGCILPKTVGRATAGKVWTVLADGVAARISKGGKGEAP